METKQCPVCWGKGVICVGLRTNLDPILGACIGCDGTGWLVYEIKEEEVRTKVITDNISERLAVKWDGTRFIITQQYKGRDELPVPRIIVFNPKEMLDIVKFASNLGDDCDKES